MIRLETKEDFERARARLRQRDADSLAAFLMSLAGESGPVGDQVRTFIVGDDIAETVQSVRDRIRGLKIPSEYEHRHSLGREMGKNLYFIVDSVERLVLPKDPNAAFDLLVTAFEADAVAMENCGEHDWDVTCAYKRAADVMAEAVKKLPGEAINERLNTLIEGDGYGMRTELKSLLLKLQK
jgi:hypothetical protein